MKTKRNMHWQTTATRTATEITPTGCSTKTSSDGTIFASFGMHAMNFCVWVAGGLCFFLNEIKWNQNNVLTTCKQSSRVLPADLCSDCSHKPKINGFEKDQNHGLFSYNFGNSQLYWCYVTFQTKCMFCFFL